MRSTKAQDPKAQDPRSQDPKSTVQGPSRRHRGSARRGFTLLEVILALGISTLVVAGLWMAVDFQLRATDTGRYRVEQRFPCGYRSRRKPQHDKRQQSQQRQLAQRLANAVGEPGCPVGQCEPQRHGQAQQCQQTQPDA